MRYKPVIKVARIITVTKCNIGLRIMFVKLREIKILVKGDFRFYI
jgi:hypothetical protein